MRVLAGLVGMLGLLAAVGAQAQSDAPQAATPPAAAPASPRAQPPAPSEPGATSAMEDMRVAVLQGLDKITARISTINAVVGQPVKFGSLDITVRACRKAPPIEPPESAAFLEIADAKPGEEPAKVFSGWMFASSPGLSALEHPVYDVWVIDCRNAATNASSSPQ